MSPNIQTQHLEPLPTHESHGFTNPDEVAAYYQGAMAGQTAAGFLAVHGLETERINQVTALNSSNENLRYRLTHDTMVPALLNKQTFNFRLEGRLADEVPTAVIFADFDDFKEMNDTLGHDIGDEVIINFGERLASELRNHGQEDEIDLVAHERIYSSDGVPEAVNSSTVNKDSEGSRFGGDEFVFMINPNGRKQNANQTEQEQDIGAVEERIGEIYAEALDEVSKKHGVPLKTSGITMGWAIARPGEKHEDVLRRADQSMLEAKQAKPERKGRS
jgi:GGDEF domain-containing protein